MRSALTHHYRRGGEDAHSTLHSGARQAVMNRTTRLDNRVTVPRPRAGT